MNVARGVAVTWVGLGSDGVAIPTPGSGVGIWGAGVGGAAVGVAVGLLPGHLLNTNMPAPMTIKAPNASATPPITQIRLELLLVVWGGSLTAAGLTDGAGGLGAVESTAGTGFILTVTSGSTRNTITVILSVPPSSLAIWISFWTA